MRSQIFTRGTFVYISFSCHTLMPELLDWRNIKSQIIINRNISPGQPKSIKGANGTHQHLYMFQVPRNILQEAGTYHHIVNICTTMTIKRPWALIGPLIFF